MYRGTHQGKHFLFSIIGFEWIKQGRKNIIFLLQFPQIHQSWHFQKKRGKNKVISMLTCIFLV